MVAGGQVSPHHRDRVTGGLPRPAGRQQPQLPGAPHGRVHVGGVGAHRDLLDLAQHREPVSLAHHSPVPVTIVP
jgi:hypothetical protein